MRMLRTMIAVVLAVSVACGPVWVMLAFATGAGAHTAHGTHAMHHDIEAASMAGEPDSAMADCDRAAPASSNSGCHCCDKSSKCPDQASCLTKCCAKVLGTLETLPKVGQPRLAHVRPADPLRPPDWTSAPPAPPPRT